MATAILSVIVAALGIPIFTNGILLAFGNAQNIGTYLTILLGLALIIIAIFMKLIKKLFIYPLFKLLCMLLCFVCVLAIISSSFLFIYGRANTTTYKEDYLVVLGCGLNGTEPSETLVKRLDKAIEYANRNTDCTIIVTGGQGVGEDIPEAEAMANYLVENGISSDRILQENNSTSTYENFDFANRITDGDLYSKSSVFITNDFHVYRANSIARLQGLAINHLSASTPWHSLISSYLRENLAIIRLLFFK